MPRRRAPELLDGPAPPRVLVTPSCTGNSWEDVAELASSLGYTLDEWQEQVLEAGLGERRDGQWSSKFVGLSAPRQNGKSQLIVARALAGVLLFGERSVIISAHEMDTAREVWRRLLDVVDSNPSLARRVTARMNAVNREALTFGEGSDRQIIKLKARSATGSRGFSCDALLLDEAQILGKTAWGAILPTLSAMPNPQVWLFGTPPTDKDDPFAFTRVRESGLARKARHTWVEWSATEKDDPDDPAVWARANPSFGQRVDAEACADERAAMDVEQFRRERLGLWPDAVAAPIMSRWPECGRPDMALPEMVALGLGGTPDGLHASIGAAGMVEGDVAVGVVERRAGQEWVVAEAARIQAERQCDVVMDGRGPLSHLIPSLEGAGVRLTLLETAQYVSACEGFWQAVCDRRLRHGRHPVLDVAVRAAGWRNVGDRRAFARRRGDIDMLEAVAVAAHVVSTVQTSVYESRGVLAW